MHSLKILMILCLITCTAVACGQPGPLYLPDKPAPVIDKTEVPDTEKDKTEKKDGQGNAKNP